MSTVLRKVRDALFHTWTLLPMKISLLLPFSQIYTFNSFFKFYRFREIVCIQYVSNRRVQKNSVSGVTSAAKCVGCAHLIFLGSYPSRTAQTFCVHRFATSPHYAAFDINNCQFLLSQLIQTSTLGPSPKKNS